MQDQGPGHGSRLGLPQPRGTLDVGESKGHRPARQLRLPGLTRPGRRPARRRDAFRRAAKALAQDDRKVVGQQPLQLSRRSECPVRRGAGCADTVNQRRQAWLLVGSGTLQVQQHGLARGQAVLVFQARDVHPRGHPAVPLPVDTHEHLALRQVGPVHAARRVRTSTRLIPHRHQAQPLDGPPGGHPLTCQLFHSRGDKDPDPLVRREDNIGPGPWRLVADRGPRTRALRVLILAPCPTAGPHKGTVRQYPADVNRQAGPGHPAILRLTGRWRRS
jgi:hypothetical protein